MAPREDGRGGNEGTSRVGMKCDAVIDPSLEKTLLSLHAAMDVGSFWKAIQKLLAAALPNRLIRPHASTQSKFANDYEMDIAHA